MATLTAAAQNQPPQTPPPLGEDIKRIDVAGNGIVVVIPECHSLQPFTDGRHGVMHPTTKLCFYFTEFRYVRFFAVIRQTMKSPLRGCPQQ